MGILKKQVSVCSKKTIVIENGVFPMEKYGVETHLDLTLRQDILTYGVANSMFNAQMPTATSAQIHSSTESYETLTNNIYVED